jgi:hypothetical protein
MYTEKLVHRPEVFIVGKFRLINMTQSSLIALGKFPRKACPRSSRIHVLTQGVLEVDGKEASYYKGQAQAYHWKVDK